jgi:hypothetical protein
LIQRLNKAKSSFFEESTLAGCWWLTPAILTTWKTEFKTSKFEASPGKNRQDPISKTPNTKRT